MARPPKEGLDYFPLDVDISADERVEFIEARYGLEGFAVIIKLLTAIYRNGYYIKWDEMQIYVTSRRVSYPVNHLTDVVNDLVNYDFFNKNLYEKYKILTSHGIQTRYLQACEKRKSILMVKEFCLLTDDDSFKESRFSYQKPPFLVKGVNNSQADIVKGVNNSQADIVKGVKSTQSKVKESNISTTTTARTCEDDMVDKELAKIIQAYSDNIHPVTPMEFEDISSWMEDYGFSSELIIKAIGRAVDAGKRSKGYVKGILRSWKENGLDDPGDKKGGRQYGRNRGNDSRNRSKRERDDKYADFDEADRRQVHPWDLPADGSGAGAEPGKDT
jgi:DnaD/phage-associated family protein